MLLKRSLVGLLLDLFMCQAMVLRQSTVTGLFAKEICSDVPVDHYFAVDQVVKESLLQKP